MSRAAMFLPRAMEVRRFRRQLEAKQTDSVDRPNRSQSQRCTGAPSTRNDPHRSPRGVHTTHNSRMLSFSRAREGSPLVARRQAWLVCRHGNRSVDDVRLYRKHTIGSKVTGQPRSGTLGFPMRLAEHSTAHRNVAARSARRTKPKNKVTAVQQSDNRLRTLARTFGIMRLLFEVFLAAQNRSRVDRPRHRPQTANDVVYGKPNRMGRRPKANRRKPTTIC